MPHPPGVRPLPFGLITVVRLIFTWTPTFLSNFHSIFPSIHPSMEFDMRPILFFWSHTSFVIIERHRQMQGQEHTTSSSSQHTHAFRKPPLSFFKVF